MQRGTLHDIIKKYIDFGSEEYVETMLEKQDGSKILQLLNPYIGVISYPSDDFLQRDLTYRKQVQFQNMTYVGHMEMLLPPIDALSNVDISYSILQFTLDNRVLKFIQISHGFAVSQGITFKDFILQKFPGCSKPFAFNRHAFHVLTDIEIYGGTFVPSPTGDAFTDAGSGAGAFTPSLAFEFAVSGFKCLMQ
jgi:hypothetical protein